VHIGYAETETESSSSDLSTSGIIGIPSSCEVQYASTPVPSDSPILSPCSPDISFFSYDGNSDLIATLPQGTEETSESQARLSYSLSSTSSSSPIHVIGASTNLTEEHQSSPGTNSCTGVPSSSNIIATPECATSTSSNAAKEDSLLHGGHAGKNILAGILYSILN
jgi:hypothetical protein